MADIKGQKKNLGRQFRHARIRAKVEGTPNRPRLSVFRSLSNIYAQIIDDEAGKTIVSASTIDTEIKGQLEGKNKTEAAKLVGKLVAERAKSAGVSAVVFDRGGYKYHGRIAALAEAAREAGLEF